MTTVAVPSPKNQLSQSYQEMDMQEDTMEDTMEDELEEEEMGITLTRKRKIYYTSLGDTP